MSEDKKPYEKIAEAMKNDLGRWMPKIITNNNYQQNNIDNNTDMSSHEKLKANLMLLREKRRAEGEYGAN